ncbi:MAG: glycosyltransferase [Blautia sp.]|nr:glycosyltransferase [Blautia sp.]
MSPQIAVLVPCYNEGQTVGKVVRDFKEALPEATVYVYDNNSTDNTYEEAKNAGAVVRKEPMQGKGNVVRSMFRDIDADVYLMVDGDDTYPAESAREMVDKVLNEGYDMVIGDRLSSTYFSENKCLSRSFGNEMAKWWINFLFHAHLHDILTGYRAMSFDFAKTYPTLHPGFELETEMTMQALDKRCRMIEIPVKFRERPAGSFSKMKPFSDGLGVAKAFYVMVSRFRPVFFFGLIASFCFAAAIGLWIWGGVAFGCLNAPSEIFVLIGGALCALGGFFSLAVGAVLNMQAKHAREKYIVDCNAFSLKRKEMKKARS